MLIRYVIAVDLGLPEHSVQSSQSAHNLLYRFYIVENLYQYVKLIDTAIIAVTLGMVGKIFSRCHFDIFL